MKYPSTDGVSKSRVVSTPAMQRYHGMKAESKRAMMPKTPFQPDQPIAKKAKTPKARPDETPHGFLWKRDALGEWALQPDPEEEKAALLFNLQATEWLNTGGLDAIHAWMANLQCVEHPCCNPDCVNPEPSWPVEIPLAIKRYLVKWMAMPPDKAAVQCRTGRDGPRALMVALKLVGAARRAEFEAADDARELARLKEIAEEKAKDTTNGEAWVGPNGETAATHIRVVEHQKCGGKGQTVEVITFVPIEKVASDDDEPECKRGEIRWPLDPNQRKWLDKYPINMM
jgi:hypothetical protein